MKIKGFSQIVCVFMQHLSKASLTLHYHHYHRMIK